MIKTGAKIGAAVGASIALITLVLSFWPLAGGGAAIERLEFRTCPFLILGFVDMSTTTFVIITIVGNTILYGIGFGIIAAIVFFCKRFRFHAK